MLFRSLLLSAISISFFACKNDQANVEYEVRTVVETELLEFSIPGTTIRAIESLNDSTIWFAGSNGKWGYTKNNGANWTIEIIEDEGKKPNFRSIAVQDNGDVFLVAIEEPAAIFKSSDQGQNWSKVHEGPSTESFFDAVEFWNDDKGILLGDPQNNCFYVALTSDGGDTWTQVDCAKLPPALPEEYPFAASNTNIALAGSHVWFGTGGESESRVYHSADWGKNWEVISTPIVSGKGMTGIYSIDFFDQNNGVIAGGNWDAVSENTGNMASTKDGGKTWNLLFDGENEGYTSCIQYIPETDGKELFLLKGRSGSGASSMSYLYDSMDTIQSFSNDNYLSLQFVDRNTAWIAGKNKIAKLTIE